MVDVRISGVVHAPPEKVFAFLADFQNWPRWQSDMKTVQLMEGAGGSVGAKYRYVSKAMGRTFDSSVTITAVDAGRRVAFEGDWAGMIRPSGEYVVEEHTEGTLVTKSRSSLIAERARARDRAPESGHENGCARGCGIRGSSEAAQGRPARSREG